MAQSGGLGRSWEDEPEKMEAEAGRSSWSWRKGSKRKVMDVEWGSVAICVESCESRKQWHFGFYTEQEKKEASARFEQKRAMSSLIFL